MRQFVWFLLGVFFVVLISGVCGFIFIRTARGFSARTEPSALETWLARKARGIAIPADAQRRPNPIEVNAQVLAEARAHWAGHCAACHANNGSGDTEMGRHLYPPAPDMRNQPTQRMTDGELFYIIENGIRLSGMPAWGAADHGEDDSWKLVHFIRHLPQVSFAEQQEMEKLNPKTPAELEEEKQEEEFLKGNDTHETKQQSHRH